jgi:undecaprenyl-diphosphatase
MFVAVAVALAVGVGLSRIYLAVHWATDVAGGWSLAIAWLSLAALLQQYFQPHAGALGHRPSRVG